MLLATYLALRLSSVSRPLSYHLEISSPLPESLDVFIRPISENKGLLGCWALAGSPPFLPWH